MVDCSHPFITKISAIPLAGAGEKRAEAKWSSGVHIQVEGEFLAQFLGCLYDLIICVVGEGRK